MKSGLIASIDLGTNTARLLIGSCENGRIDRRHISRRITRLGGGFTREVGISPEAAARTLAAMTDFAATLKEFKVSALKAVATSAVRDAANRDVFCREVFTATGIELEVISGSVEGELTLQGVVRGLDVRPEIMLVFDVGGGSTEYTLARGETILFTRSLPLGVVRLSEGKDSIAAMSDKISRELGVLVNDIKAAGVAGFLPTATLVATAGTATTLAAIDLGLADYDYRLVNNHLLTAATINEIFQRLLPLSPFERLQQTVGLERGREDLIIAGTLLTLKSMELLGVPSLKVSDFGLLEGVLFDLAAAGDAE
jgi:exopolyphosphatase/guanosine-5'-triphosphate,3'-diphosphate pyrophosphatase